MCFCVCLSKETYRSCFVYSYDMKKLDVSWDKGFLNFILFSFWCTLCLFRVHLPFHGFYGCLTWNPVIMFAFTGKEQEVIAMEVGGNTKVNQAYEAKLTEQERATVKPDPTSALAAREKFIKHKYENRTYFDLAVYNNLDFEPPSLNDVLKDLQQTRLGPPKRGKGGGHRSVLLRQHSMPSSTLHLLANMPEEDLFADANAFAHLNVEPVVQGQRTPQRGNQNADDPFGDAKFDRFPSSAKDGSFSHFDYSLTSKDASFLPFGLSKHDSDPFSHFKFTSNSSAQEISVGRWPRCPSL